MVVFATDVPAYWAADVSTPKNQKLCATLFFETLPLQVRVRPSKVPTVSKKGMETKRQRLIEGMAAFRIE